MLAAGTRVSAKRAGRAEAEVARDKTVGWRFFPGIAHKSQEPNMIRNTIFWMLLGCFTHAAVTSAEEITLIHIGDTHYNTGSDDFEAQREQFQRLIDCMNALPGTPYPQEVGGSVGRPMGVFIVGDLTESRQADFDVLAEDWGLKGGDGRLDFPVFEGAGNHDGPPSTHPRGDVRRAIIARNPHRPHLASLSENQLHYSLNYQGVHFVQLNEYAGLDSDERYSGNRAYNRKGQAYGNPAEESLQFLKQTLAEHVGDSGRPVILFQHYGFDGWPLNPWGDELAWWTEEQALRLWETIEGYNVIALMVGHDHSHNVMQWNGIPVYHMDAVRGYAVYRITGEELVRVVRYPQEGRWGPVHRQSTSVFAGPPDELVQGPYLVYNNDPSNMTLLWRTERPSKTTLRWGRENFRLELGEVQVEPYEEGDGLYRVTLTDLEPNTRYVYQLQVGNQFAPGMFYTAPAPDADRVKFLIYGGTGQGVAEHERISQALYDKIYEDPAYHSLLLHAGDWVPQIDRLSAWDAHFFNRSARHTRYVQARLPIVGAVGLHQGNTELFQQLFPFPYAGAAYHSFRYGPVHVTVMDALADYSEGSDQYQWLVDDLKNATAPWKILVHTGRHALEHESPAGEAARKGLHSLCEEHEVSLVIDGTSRGYAHTRVGSVQYLGLGPAPSEREDEPDTLFFGALQIEGSTLNLEVFDDAGQRVETVERTAE